MYWGCGLSSCDIVAVDLFQVLVVSVAMVTGNTARTHQPKECLDVKPRPPCHAHLSTATPIRVLLFVFSITGGDWQELGGGFGWLYV